MAMQNRWVGAHWALASWDTHKICNCEHLDNKTKLIPYVSFCYIYMYTYSKEDTTPASFAQQLWLFS